MHGTEHEGDTGVCAVCGRPIRCGLDAWFHYPAGLEVDDPTWHLAQPTSPVLLPPPSALTTVASTLGLVLLQRRLAAGHRIEIPSLGIVIDPPADPPAPNTDR